jgi:hypothetical protein
VIVDVVGCPFLEPTEEPEETGPDPERGRDPSPGVGGEDPPEAFGTELSAK